MALSEDIHSSDSEEEEQVNVSESNSESESSHEEENPSDSEDTHESPVVNKKPESSTRSPSLPAKTKRHAPPAANEKEAKKAKTHSEEDNSDSEDDPDDSGSEDHSDSEEKHETLVDKPNKLEAKPKKKPESSTRSRHALAASEKEAEKAKTQKILFQRLWIEEDVVAILQGLSTFGAKNYDSDKPGFYKFIKSALSVDCTEAQLHGKVRKLKEKFERKRERKNITNEHARNVHQLSKSIWGITSDGVKMKTDFDISRFDDYGSRSMYGPISIKEIEKISEMHPKWKKLKTMELETFVLRTSILQEVANEVLKSNKNEEID